MSAGSSEVWFSDIGQHAEGAVLDGSRPGPCGARPCELPPPARPYRGRARRALNGRKGRDQSKSEETLVSSAMRLIASPSSGATVRARALALPLNASVGWVV